MLKGLSQEEKDRLLPKNIVLLGWRGSIAHGTYVPQEDPDSIDDKDLMGIFISPLDHYFGLKEAKVYEKMDPPWDIVAYDIKKMFSLLLKSNPNVLSMLWLDETGIVNINNIGMSLMKHRDIFLSKRIYHAFIGYVTGQSHRMEHYKFEGYMGEKRKKLVETLGYDAKNASHMIRILRMGIEALTEKKFHVMRHDAQELIDIKKGRWELAKVKEEAEHLRRLADEAYVRSTLPDEPDYDKANKLLANILGHEFYGQELRSF